MTNNKNNKDIIPKIINWAAATMFGLLLALGGWWANKIDTAVVEMGNDISEIKTIIKYNHKNAIKDNVNSWLKQENATNPNQI